jgi:general secretion pathway protein F
MGVGGDLPGRLGAIASRIAGRMDAGESLPGAIAAEGTNLPASYRAVVEAGLRSGRLSAALEGLAGFARGHVEMRRAVGLALLYPTIVLLLAYGLFLSLVTMVIPPLLDAFVALRVPVIAPLKQTARLGEHLWLWGPILPAIVMAGVVVWLVSGRASSLGSGRGGRFLRWLPGMRRIVDAAVAAQFADWLAMLVDHGVPWDESIELAAQATGDAKLVESARVMAESSRRGEPIERGVREATAFPALLRWLMTAGSRQGSLVPALQYAAFTYRRRAMRRAAALRAILPMVLLLGIGGTATLVYLLTLFLPWTTLLYKISK